MRDYSYMLDRIGAFNYTFEDYYGKSAIMVFLLGCNVRCRYCYKWKLVFGEKVMSDDEINTYLKRDIRFIDSIVLSGGEPTIYSYDELMYIIDFFKNKNQDLLVKLDTNGIRYDVIEQLLRARAIDSIGLDIKAPLRADTMKEVFMNMGNDKVERVIDGVKHTIALCYEYMNYLDLIDFRTVKLDNFKDEYIGEILGSLYDVGFTFDVVKKMDYFVKFFEKRLDNSRYVIYRIRVVDKPKTYTLEEAVEMLDNDRINR